jgi:cell migration-inducing and hyaluronan-binding protein
VLKLIPVRHRRLAAILHSRSSLCLLLGLMAAFQFATPACADMCTGGTASNPTVINPNMMKLPLPGPQPDLTVTGTCIINQAGNYYYGQVNIYSGGSLTFAEPAAASTQVAFWASSVIVEYNSSLIVGGANPFGSNGGFLTIYLYGSDDSKGMNPATNQGQGALCKTLPLTATIGPCGIPVSVWSSNGKSVIPGCGTAPLTGQKCIPGLPSTVSDYFYQYGPLYGDGRCTTSTPNMPVVFVNGKCGNSSADGLVGYFGYKTLAVSFGGTLRIHGYKGTSPTNVDGDHLNAGVSWIRLAQDLTPGTATLKLASSVADRWWRMGDKSPPPNSTDLDQIVVTTTDYLPSHSETFTVTGIDSDGITVHFSPPARWLHRGTRFPIANRLGSAQARLVSAGMDLSLIQGGAETRAAVALLTRNVRIVSGGDMVGQTLANMPANYSFGGHTIFRQGFQQVQVQGVELQDLGQGGKIGHYPIHFHETRLVPSAFNTNPTYIKDSAVNGSMTRWYVLHSTQGVTLARNVGFKSIGHGYYLENGTETDNNFYADIGIMARAAIQNTTENPRSVPGILSDNTDPAKYPDPNVPAPGFPYRSDNEHPTIFWITNGWNDFQGNMAAGAATCGACYWFIPTANNDTPDVLESGKNDDNGHMKWDDGNGGGGVVGYAGMQRSSVFAGATPLKSFYKNYCTSAMHSFQTTPDAPACNGFISAGQSTPPNLPNVQETKSFAPSPIYQTVPAGPTSPAHKAVNPLAGTYYPYSFGARFATQCPLAAKQVAGRPPVYDCSSVHVCSDGTTTASNADNCTAVVLDHYTSAFNWANGNISAVWLRPQWYLLDNSVLSSPVGTSPTPRLFKDTGRCLGTRYLSGILSHSLLWPIRSPPISVRITA